jgi:hypothetical protein
VMLDVQPKPLGESVDAVNNGEVAMEGRQGVGAWEVGAAESVASWRARADKYSHLVEVQTVRADTNLPQIWAGFAQNERVRGARSERVEPLNLVFGHCGHQRTPNVRMQVSLEMA